jgi:hypothetical protein
LATVRIYKVAELLNTTSQEVVALLKRDHGIEVKSASSTIEEVVGRQFVDRLARQRGITLPSGDIFAEGAAAKAAPKKPGLVKKGAAEPPKPATPTLGPPRLIKAAKAIHQAERAAAAAQAEDAEAAAAVAELGDADHEVFEAAAPAPELLEPAAATTDDAVAEVDVPAAEAPAGELVDEPAVATGAPEPTAAPEHAPERAAPAAEAAPSRQAPAAPLPSGCASKIPMPPCSHDPRPGPRRRGRRRRSPGRRPSWVRPPVPGRRRSPPRVPVCCRRGRRRPRGPGRPIRRRHRSAARVRCLRSRFGRSSRAWAPGRACPPDPACRAGARDPVSRVAGVPHPNVR